jgi:hypothetical protein
MITNDLHYSKIKWMFDELKYETKNQSSLVNKGNKSTHSTHMIFNTFIRTLITPNQQD